MTYPADTFQAIGLDSTRFVERVIEDLRKAGVQNTYKGELGS